VDGPLGRSFPPPTGFLDTEPKSPFRACSTDEHCRGGSYRTKVTMSIGLGRKGFDVLCVDPMEVFDVARHEHGTTLS
jgi:hypothetical protein